MSSILKALKKVEQQKAPRPKFEMDIASGIMREKRAGKRRRWVIPAGMIAVAVIAALTTYGLVAPRRNAPTAEPVLTAKVAATLPAIPTGPTAVPPTAGSHPPTPPPAAAPPSVSAAPRAAAAVTPPAAVKAQQPVSAVPPPSAQRQGATAREARALPPVEQEVPIEPRKAHAPAAPGVPKLNLSGIAWQKDSANRFAVVNGTSVSEGAVIEGAKVEEIMQDKVKFSAGQRTFEIHIGKIQN